jgi:hypothetical protein
MALLASHVRINTTCQHFTFKSITIRARKVDCSRLGIRFRFNAV